MRVTKLLSGAFTVLLGLLLIDFAFAAPLDSNDGDLVNGYLTPGNSHGTNINATAITPIFTMDGAGDKWGGAVFKQPPSGHFTAVQGTFTIPKPSMPVGQAMVQVGFGGTTDSNNYWLQVGILLYVYSSLTSVTGRLRERHCQVHRSFRRGWIQGFPRVVPCERLRLR